MQIPNPFEAAVELGRVLAAAANGDRIIVSKDTAKLRTKVCSLCPRRDTGSNQCMECSCWLPLAVHVATKKCPLGKWPVTNA